MESKKEFEEQIIQKFPYRCPYCDQSICYDQFDLKIGENEIQCPSCKRKYIKVVVAKSSSPRRACTLKGRVLARRRGRG